MLFLYIGTLKALGRYIPPGAALQFKMARKNQADEAPPDNPPATLTAHTAAVAETIRQALNR